MGDQRAVGQSASARGVVKGSRFGVALPLLRYISFRALIIMITVAVGIYVAIWVSNLGGFSDQIRRDVIRGKVVETFYGDKEFWELPHLERQAIIDERAESFYAAADLDQPFWRRSFGYFANAFSLNLGESRNTNARITGSTSVLGILLENLPLTLLLFATANLITFIGGLFIALVLSQRYGSALDRVTTLLLPVFSAPPWLHGVFLIVVFASVWRILPYGGLIDTPLPDAPIAYLLSLLKHMVLPVSAWVLGTIPQAIYTNRAFFLIHSGEDYVELAKAKGVRPGKIQSRHILRPVLPPVITSFAMLMIVSWQGAILMEFVFAWPGIGSLLIEAVRGNDVQITIGIVTIFGYLLAGSVLILDIVYALVDPRVKLGARSRD